MKLLLTSPDFRESALNFDNKKRLWSNLIVASKFIQMFKTQQENDFNVPTYKCWYGIDFEFEEALKLYYNCLLDVAKNIYNYKTKLIFFEIDKNKLKFPNFTDLTFFSHQAFLVKLDPILYKPKFSEKVYSFNGNCAIWEYPLLKNGEVINCCEDFNGIFKPLKVFDNLDIKDDYDFFKINEKYLNLC